MPQADLLLAVDVGSRSARAGLFAADGGLLQMGSAGFELRHPEPDHAVYRMDDIWAATMAAIRAALAAAPGAAARVAHSPSMPPPRWC